MDLEHECLVPSCRHKWIGRKLGRPVECPACKHRDWDDREKWKVRPKETKEIVNAK